ncbi:MAG: hypothetical protein WCF12_15625 [Propionicimonas sp.]
MFESVDEIAHALAPERWILVGGLMVHAHARLAGITHPRPTDDADLVVELRAGNYSEAARALQGLGYQRHESLDHRAPFHRFARGSEQVDLMAPEGKPVRFAGRDVLRVPGSRSALNRTIVFTTPTGVMIRIPDLASALSLKGAAYQLPGINRVRHLQDAVTLFACADTTAFELSTSMRRNVNILLNALDTTEPWAATDPSSRRRAVRAIRQIRPEWAIPVFVLSQRPGTTRPVSTPGDN